MSQIQGHADGFAGNYALGWAIDRDSLEPCRIEVTNAAGEVLGQGQADRKRDDLAALGFGRTDVGFRVPVSRLLAAGQVHVKANGVELRGSPVKIGPAIFDGQISVSQGCVRGTVTARVSRAATPRITVFGQDGVLLAEGDAVPLAAEDPFYAPARFDLKLDFSAFGRKELALRGFADGVYFAQTSAALTLDGFLDHLSADRCAGWLVCPEAAARLLRLRVYRDGALAGSGDCDVPRLDVRAKYPDSLVCGFSIALEPATPGAPDLTEISIRLDGAEQELFDGPYILAARQAIMATGKKLAQLTHAPEINLSTAERALFQEVLRGFLETRRHGEAHSRLRGLAGERAEHSPRRLTILIPVYKGMELTTACIESVLADRGPTDAVLLLADAPPEPGMMPMLRQFARRDQVFLLTNPRNLGFVGTVNRGLAFFADGDVLLLNADTRLYRGCIDEMHAVLHAAPEIGTVTALSNNATIFSYPHPDLACAGLEDVSLRDLAQVALAKNRGQSIMVPTAHGFCMLIRRALLDRLPQFNTVFGRGYGEENEFCLRAMDLGFTHVAALGALVEHRESVSFGSEKEALLRVNLAKLESLFPEYAACVQTFQKTDALRAGRWPLDAYRLQRASVAGLRFVVTVETWLGGGSTKAARDIEALVGYGDRTHLRLFATEDGRIELECAALVLRAVFLPGEAPALIDLLEQARADLVVVHQLVGFSAAMIEAIGQWAARRRAYFYTHDFYPACPRVTLIDAVDRFCGLPSADICERCIKLGGAHTASRLEDLTVAEHRALFTRFFAGMTRLIVPSADTAGRLAGVFPDARMQIIPHPNEKAAFSAPARVGQPGQVVLVGAIGAHKGSHKLLEIARRALLSQPQLHFTVIGFTNLDKELGKIDNVTITGRYEEAELPGLLQKTEAGIALFLHGWPETFSYTLSEVVAHGLLPMVPDIGAPAERVRASGWGLVFPFPIDAGEVLEMLAGCWAASLQPGAADGLPTKLDRSDSIEILKGLLHSSSAEPG